MIQDHQKVHQKVAPTNFVTAPTVETLGSVFWEGSLIQPKHSTCQSCVRFLSFQLSRFPSSASSSLLPFPCYVLTLLSTDLFLKSLKLYFKNSHTKLFRPLTLMCPGKLHSVIWSLLKVLQTQYMHQMIFVQNSSIQWKMFCSCSCIFRVQAWIWRQKRCKFRNPAKQNSWNFVWIDDMICIWTIYKSSKSMLSTCVERCPRKFLTAGLAAPVPPGLHLVPTLESKRGHGTSGTSSGTSSGAAHSNTRQCRLQ